MDYLSVFDAKSKLSEVLDQVEKGREVVITRDGKPVARLIAAGAPGRPLAAADKLRALRKGIAARGERLTWSELKAYRDEGRG